MKTCILERVRYKLPGPKEIVRWAILVSQREGLSLLLVPRTEAESTHGLVIAVEDVSKGFCEDARVSRFPLEPADLAGVGETLEALGDPQKNKRISSFASRNAR